MYTLILSACSVNSPETVSAYAESPFNEILEPTPLPSDNITAEVTLSDSNVVIGFLGASAFLYNEIINDVSNRLLQQSSLRVEIESDYVDTNELIERISLGRDDSRMINAFVASFSDFADLPILNETGHGIEIGILISESSESGDYVALFLRRELVDNSHLIRDLIAGGFQPIIDIDNVAKLHRDTTAVSQSLRLALEQSTAFEGLAPEVASSIIMNAGGRLITIWDAEMPRILYFSLNAEVGDAIEIVAGDSEIAFTSYISDVDAIVVYISVEAEITDGGELSFRWYERFEDGELQYIENSTNCVKYNDILFISTLHVAAADVGQRQFYVEITNINRNVNGQQETTAPHRRAIINLKESVLEPYVRFEVFFDAEQYVMAQDLQITDYQGIYQDYNRKYGGNQRDRLQNFVNNYVLNDPNVTHIRVDGRFWGQFDGAGDGKAITRDRANTIVEELRNMGVTVPIHPTRNLIQENDHPWRHRRAEITVALHGE